MSRIPGMPLAKPFGASLERQSASSRSTTIRRWFRQRAPWLLVALGVLGIAVLVGMAWLAAMPILDEMAQIERYRLPKLQLLHAAKHSDLDASVALRNILVARDPELDRQELARHQSAQRAAAQALERFSELPQQPEEMKLVQQLLQERSRLRATREAVLAADQQHGTPDPDAVTRTLQRELDRYLERLDQLQDYQSSHTHALLSQLASRAGSVIWLLSFAGLVMLLTLLAAAFAWRAQLRSEVGRREQRIASLQAQKLALVGEVHHRIKNHLQGLLGLVETHQRQQRHQRAGRDGPGADVLATLRGHVLALVGIHGLQARDPSKEVTVKDLLRRQVELVRAGMGEAPIAVSDDAELDRVALAQDASVCMALIVTELLVNAVKHGNGSPVHVAVTRIDGEGGMRIAVRNRLAGPLELDWNTGRGIGTGLSLVASLAEGVAQLQQQSTNEEITMSLLVHVGGPAEPA